MAMENMEPEIEKITWDQLVANTLLTNPICHLASN